MVHQIAMVCCKVVRMQHGMAFCFAAYETGMLDPVAYVRFASVYREFKDIDQFMDTIRALTHDKGRS